MASGVVEKVLTTSGDGILLSTDEDIVKNYARSNVGIAC